MDDSYLVTAIKLLHSSAPDSAEKMRAMLNTEILKHYDKTKLVENHLSKKQIDSLISQENKAVGSGFKLKKHKTKKIEEIKMASTPIIENQQIIKSRDDDMDSDNSSAAMDLLTDLTCVSCREMDNSANNQLYECIECGQLWHSLCHPTKIPNDANQNSWTCSTCKGKKEGSSKSTKSCESSPSSSSSSYKHKEKEEKIKQKEKEKEKEKEKSSTDKKKSEGGSSSSSNSKKKSKEPSSSSSSSRSRSSKKSS